MRMQAMRWACCLSCVLMLCAVPVMAEGGKRFTLVIDPGHGGHDHGAPGAISIEKNLTLRYALAFGKLVETHCPDVRVVYTRKRDVYLKLFDRAEIANREHADLFISFHVNAVEGSHNVRGFQTYTLGRGNTTGNKGILENLDVAKRENSVIYMEKDYQQVYKGIDLNSAEGDIMFEFIADKNREKSVELARYMQREVCKATGRHNGGAHQNNLAVLRLTSMPSCLLELGFISTPDEERFLNTDAAVNQYASGIYNAFVQYKNRYSNKNSVPYKTIPTEGQQLPEVVPDEYREASQTTRRAVPMTKLVPAKKVEEQSAQAKEETKTQEPQVQPDGRPVFKIQIMASPFPLKQGDKQLKGLSPVESYEEGEYVKYTYGASTNYNEIYRLRKTILDKFPEAFIVAFRGDQKMNVNQAIREFKSNR